MRRGVAKIKVILAELAGRKSASGPSSTPATIREAHCIVFQTQSCQTQTFDHEHVATSGGEESDKLISTIGNSTAGDR